MPRDDSVRTAKDVARLCAPDDVRRATRRLTHLADIRVLNPLVPHEGGSGHWRHFTEQETLVAAVALLASQYGLPVVRLQAIAETVRTALRIKDAGALGPSELFKKIRGAAYDDADVSVVWEFSKDLEARGSAAFINHVSAYEGEFIPKPKATTSALVMNLRALWQDLPR